MAARSIVATSAAQLYCPWANASKSRPCGFAKNEFSSPSSAAFAFMASTNAASQAYASPPDPFCASIRAPAAWAMADAASLPEAVSSAFSASSKVIESPCASPALDSPTLAASGVTSIIVDASSQSAATIAVMIFVSEAICAASSPLRPNHSVPSSSMSAAQDASRSGSRSGGKARSAALRRSTMSSSSTEPKAAASGRHARRPTRVRQAAVRRWRRRAFIGCSSGACGGFVYVTVYALESVAWEAA